LPAARLMVSKNMVSTSLSPQQRSSVSRHNLPNSYISGSL
jgi:hypothetical protein